MKSKAWIIVAKVMAVINGLYGVLLIASVYTAIKIFNNYPEIYSGGVRSVLWSKKFELFYILLSIPSAVLFFFHSKLGWAMQAASQTLMLLVIIAAASFVAGGGKTNGSVAGISVAILVSVLCLAGLFALFSPAVRHRFSVGTKQYISAAVFAALAVVAYYA